MRFKNLNKYLSIGICGIATFVASTSASMCFIALFNEPKMPKSLYKKD